VDPQWVVAVTSTRPRRVVLIDNDLERAGAEIQLLHLAKHLRRQGDAVLLATILPIFEFGDDPEAASLPLVHLVTSSRLRMPIAFFNAVRTLRRWKPDVAVSFVYHANVMTRLAGRIARVPIIVSSIRNERFGPPRRDWVIRLTDRLADMTTTNSHRAAARLVRDKVVPAARLVVIHNGIDVDSFTPDRVATEALRTELDAGPDAVVWIAVGRLTEQKDFDTLLRAFRIHGAAVPEARLVVVGKGELREQLEALAAELQVSDRVAFLGERTDVPALMAAADALVLSSAWEGLPNVVMEAMATGLPVVATDVGGVAELVIDGETGFTVPPGSPDHLASAMTTLATYPKERRVGLGAAGQRFVRQHFSLDGALLQWTALLDSLGPRRGHTDSSVLGAGRS
jgi:glycosyltransferase involved in cell wall biosynthesis